MHTGRTALHVPCFVLPFLLQTSTTLAFPTLEARFKNTGSSTLPTCFYDRGGNSVCQGGAPDWTNCDNSINLVCQALSTLTPGDVDSYQYNTGTGIQQGPGADCYAEASNGQNAVQTVAECVQKFAELKGCAAPTNQHFDADCVGGTINQHLGDLYDGHIIDQTLPLFILGPSGAFGQGAGQTGPAPQGKSGTSEDAGPSEAAVKSSIVAGGGSGGAAAGSGRGSATGGYLGSDYP